MARNWTDEEEKRVGKLFKRAQSVRSLWESLFDDCFRYTMPNRERFHDQTRGQRNDAVIYDETGVHGTQEFASRLQNGLVPNFSRWAELSAGPEVDIADRAAVNNALDEVNEYIFEVLNASNFATEVHECLLDLAVGTACLAIYPGSADKPLVFKAIPITRLFIDEGPDQRIGRIFYKRNVQLSDLEQAYDDLELPRELRERIGQAAEQNKGEIDIIECVVRDYEREEEEAWNEYIYWCGDDTILRKRTFEGVGSCPFIPFRWTVAAHEVWGRGPIISALSAIKTTNLVIQMILENASMSIAGIWQTDDEDVVNTDTIELTPGSIIPISPGSGGLVPLQSPGNFNVADIILSDQRLNIRRALFNDMMGDPDRSPKTATEIAERQADLARRMGAAFGRLNSELVTPIIQRVVHILRNAGRIKVPTVSGTRVGVSAVSPLSQAQAQQDILKFRQYVEMVGGTLGPNAPAMLVKPEEFSPWLQQNLSIPEKLIRNKDEINKAMEQMQEAQTQAAAPPPQGGPQGGNPPNI